MSDDPAKKYIDSHFVAATQAYEVRTFIDSMQREFPHRTKAELESAFRSACVAVKPSEGRERLKAHVRAILNGGGKA